MKLNFYTYTSQFRTSFSTAERSFTQRSGTLLYLQKNGVHAIGEAAPLPGFSTESLVDVNKQIATLKHYISNELASDFSLRTIHSFSHDYRLLPSLRFCLFTAAATYLAQQKKMGIHQFLFKTPPNSIPINTVIHLSQMDIQEYIKIKTEQGYRTFKIKVNGDIQSSMAKLKTIRNHFPDITIRLDANQSWTLSKALAFLTEAESLNIEYCEEPLKNPDFSALSQLRRATVVPVALDESLGNEISIEAAANNADLLIMKPTVRGLTLGEFKKIPHDTPLIFTTSLEGAIGRLMTASLAAGMGSKHMAHGLATGHLLTDDLWRDDQFISNGAFTLPSYDKLNALMESNLSNLSVKKLYL